ncbi:MAG: glutathione S-transferase [Gammaproteobacteria bacterium]|nr:MAG: glutathione S-transferase [Gammaproteobacteria bacterium]
MQLRYSPTSPYVRKVNISAMELRLDDEIQRIPTNPWEADTDLPAHNPLGRVPALILDDGETLFDSPVICEYLDSLREGATLFPASGTERWQALRLQALGDGMLDASVLMLIERARRPEEFRWAQWVERQEAVVGRALDTFEAEIGDFGGDFRIGQVVLSCGLGYLDFRFPELDWRHAHPTLAGWFAKISERPSVAATVPADPPA